MFTFEIKIKDMTVTFDELLFITDEGESKFPKEIRSDLINLLVLVRRKTLEEVAIKAKADVNIFKSSFYEFEKGEDYETYIIKDSILNLNENTVDI